MEDEASGRFVFNADGSWVRVGPAHAPAASSSTPANASSAAESIGTDSERSEHANDKEDDGDDDEDDDENDGDDAADEEEEDDGLYSELDSDDDGSGLALDTYDSDTLQKVLDDVLRGKYGPSGSDMSEDQRSLLLSSLLSWAKSTPAAEASRNRNGPFHTEMRMLHDDAEDEDDAFLDGILDGMLSQMVLRDIESGVAMLARNPKLSLIPLIVNKALFHMYEGSAVGFGGFDAFDANQVDPKGVSYTLGICKTCGLLHLEDHECPDYDRCKYAPACRKAGKSHNVKVHEKKCKHAPKGVRAVAKATYKCKNAPAC